jgi:hypothetical protein
MGFRALADLLVNTLLNKFASLGRSRYFIQSLRRCRRLHLVDAGLGRNAGNAAYWLPLKARTKICSRSQSLLRCPLRGCGVSGLASCDTAYEIRDP